MTSSAKRIKTPFNPYVDTYMVSYLVENKRKTHKYEDDYSPCEATDLPPELLTGALNQVREDILRIMQQSIFKKCKVKGYAIKHYKKGRWVEFERSILRKEK